MMIIFYLVHKTIKLTMEEIRQGVVKTIHCSEIYEYPCKYCKKAIHLTDIV